MKKTIFFRFSFVVSAVLFVVLGASCAQRAELGQSEAELAPQIIAAYSSGLINPDASIKIVFSRDLGVNGESPAEEPFSFSPRIKGKSVWSDARTLSFIPAGALIPEKKYEGQFKFANLKNKELNETLEQGNKFFNFTFSTVKKSYKLNIDAVYADSENTLAIEGSLALNIDVKAETVNSTLSFPRRGNTQIEWRSDNPRLYHFTITGLKKTAAQRKIILNWNARPLGFRAYGQTVVALPATKNFTVLNSEKRVDSGNKFLVTFSKPLDPQQDLRGLVTLKSGDEFLPSDSLRYSIDRGKLIIYNDDWRRITSISLSPSLRTQKGERLNQLVQLATTSPWEKPRIRFMNKGNILPTNKDLNLPIEVRNVSGIVIEARHIYSQNMIQFLQENDFDEEDGLTRTGDIVWRKRIDFDWHDVDKNEWKAIGLDLAPLLSKNKGGMFNLRITFLRDQIHYVDPKDTQVYSNLRFPDEDAVNEDFRYWQFISTLPKGWSEFYANKDNPLHPAYYIPYDSNSILISKNVLVSNLGASVQEEADGQIRVAVSDLLSAQAVSDARVTLYSYAGGLMGEAITSNQGFATIKPNKPVSFAAIEKGDQSSYVKIGDSDSLATSQFEVGGDANNDGLKGYLYGERGVWRPGDNIYLTFLLYDQLGKIPANAPLNFELLDPLGRSIDAQVITNSLNGFYTINTHTGGDAMAGSYTARVKIGGLNLSKRLSIQNIMPNRIAIDLNMAAEDKITAGNTDLLLKASWLTGAAIDNYTADVSATFKNKVLSFSALPSYVFTDPTRQEPQGRIVFFSGALSKGQAKIPLVLKPKSPPPALMQATIMTRVFEPAGVFSSQIKTVDYYPYSRYVGLKFATSKNFSNEPGTVTDIVTSGVEQSVKLVLVDNNGNKIGQGKIKLALYKLEWHWWWEKDAENLASIADRLYSRPLQTGDVTINNGEATWSFTIPKEDYGRYFVRALDNSSASNTIQGHSSGIIFYASQYGANFLGGDEMKATLNLSADKKRYQPGDTASVSFPSNRAGRALVTIEKAGLVLQQEWIDGQDKNTKYTFKVSEAMLPNAYVHVSFIQRHDQSLNDAPIRLYGIVPIMVEDSSTHLEPIITAPQEILPNSSFNLSIKEKNGQAMTCTVAIVDEGLLGLTNFKTADPWGNFYRKEASSLKLFDLYNYVIGAYSGKLETLLAIGGSDEALAGGQKKQNRFPPVVQYLGPFEVKAGESVSKQITIGNYSGALRIMVVSASKLKGSAKSNAGFGVAEKSIPVRAPLMVQLSAPRFTSPGEELSIPLTAFSFLGKQKVNATLRIIEGGHFSNDPNQTSQTNSLNFSGDGNLNSEFKIKLDANSTKLVLKAVLEAGQASAEQQVTVPVSPRLATLTKSKSIIIQAGQTLNDSIDYPGTRGSNKLVIEFSRRTPLALNERLRELEFNFYDNAENLASRGLAKLYLKTNLNLSTAEKQDITNDLTSILKNLAAYQSLRGGFSLWQSPLREDPSISVYVTHFLVLASREGLAVDQRILDSSLKFIADDARVWGSNYDEEKILQAYRLLVLSLAGQNDLPSLNRLRDFGSLPSSARALLAASYYLGGHSAEADALIHERPLLLGADDSAPNRLVRYSPSLILYALGIMNEQTISLGLYNQIARELADASNWMSNQKIALSILATLSSNAGVNEGDSVQVALKLGSQAATDITLATSTTQFNYEPEQQDRESFSITNKSKQAVMVSVFATGLASPDSMPAAEEHGLKIKRYYFDLNSNLIDPANLTLSTDFIQVTTVENTSGVELTNIMLKQDLPSIWEVNTLRPSDQLPPPSADSDKGNNSDDTSDNATVNEEPLYDYEAINEDSIKDYFSLKAGQKKVFTHYLSKNYEGKVTLPPATARTLYDRNYYALLPGVKLWR